MRFDKLSLFEIRFFWKITKDRLALAALRYANIRFKDRHAGILSETPGGGTVFEYDPGFAGEIACALPRDTARHEWPTGLHPFFEHLGPEGWLRARQARAGEIDAADDFGILLAYGRDCIGAVSVHDPARHDLPDDDRFDALTRAAVSGPRTISGIQPKLLAVRTETGAYAPAGRDGAAPWIAKFPTAELPELVLNEDLSLAALRLLLGDDQVTAAQRAQVAGIEQPALLVERFDRLPDGSKLRLEDFAQVLARPQRRDFSGKYDAGFQDGAAAIERHSARASVDLLHYFRRIAAFALLGNCDCHLKNFSLLETGGGLRLSPAYDVVNTYIYARLGYSTRFGLRIAGEAHRWEAVDRDLLASLGRAIGLTAPAVERSLDDFGRKSARLARIVAAPADAGPEHWRHLYAGSVRDACRRILAVEI